MIEIPEQLKKEDFRFVLLKPKEKLPFEKKWQNNGYRYDDPKLLAHITRGGNYGVIGGYGNLRMIDIDIPEKIDEIKNLIGETFTVKTGSGGRHFYILSEYDTNHVFISELGEFRAKNYQVVGASCIHPNGNTYQIENNSDLKTFNLEEINNLLKPYLRTNEYNSEQNNNEGTKDTTRSGIEFGEVCRILRKGYNDTQIYEHMNAYKKWSESPEQYKQLTLSKAKERVVFDKIDRNKTIKNKIIEKTDWREIAKEIIKDCPIFFDRNGLWWIWNEYRYCWELTDETDILNIIDEATERNTLASGIKTQVMEAFRRIGRKNVPKESPVNWIQFQDKIIDIETDKEYLPTPEYLHTNPIPWKLGENEDTPIIDRLCEEWVTENPDILKEIIAYGMIRDYPISRIFVLIGNGRNGKSSYLEMFRKFIGEKNSASAQLDTLVDNRFQAAKLYKKLVCFMGETNFEKIKNTDLIKRLTGRDLVDIEFKNKDGFNYINYAKIVIATNNLPPTQDKTDGFYRRWTIIDFKNQFDEKKDIITQIPDYEYENLARKLIRMLKSVLYINRGFQNEGNVLDRKDFYEKKSDPLQAFLNEYYEDSTESNTSASMFLDDFSRYCQERGHRAFNYFTVRSMMKEKGYQYGKHQPFGFNNPVACIECLRKKETFFASSSSSSSSSPILPPLREALNTVSGNVGSFGSKTDLLQQLRELFKGKYSGKPAPIEGIQKVIPSITDELIEYWKFKGDIFEEPFGWINLI